MTQWFCNGVAANNVSIDDRAFQYGDGLFETIAIRGGQPRLWDYHLDRLRRGCEQLRLVMPDAKVLRHRLDAAVQHSNENTAHCTAKVILSSGVSERGYLRKTPTEVSTFIGVFSAKTIAPTHYRDGVDTIICNTRLALFSVTAGCKTLNRLEQVLARSEFAPTAAFEGLTLDADNRLICGTMSNVFIVTNDSVITPSLERCGVEGVMRRHVIDVLSRNGIDVEVRDIGEAELNGCDEVFLANSQFGVLPVRRCGEKVWSTHAATRNIMEQMAANNVPECAV